jgi:hypothetical protein
LRPLIPLLEDWGISDDAERSHKLEAASPDSLRNLEGVVRPLIDEIEQFCDDFDAPDTYEAPLLGALAETALEAADELKRRRGTLEQSGTVCERCGGSGIVGGRPHPHIEGGWIPQVCQVCLGTGRIGR